MAISLPKDPKDKQYEDLVAAALMALGYFSETRIILKKGSSEVLELDAVATPTGDAFASRALVEAKSRKWGFADLFKVYGQMTYLGIGEGCIASPVEMDEERSQALSEISKATKVRWCRLDAKGTNLDKLAPACNSIDQDLRAVALFMSWFGQIAQRICYSKFQQWSKTAGCSELISYALAYHAATQESFFSQHALSRVHTLYEAYKQKPNLSGALVEAHCEGKDLQTRSVWNSLNDTEELPWLQYVMLLEHKARQAVIKNAIDHVLSTEKTRDKKITGRISWDVVFEHLMPDNFRQGLRKLQGHPHALRIPYLFQAFLELFGGFYIKDDKDDLRILGDVSGIPADQIEECLRLYDDFFQTPNGWFYIQKGSLACMKMVPGIIRGVGCFFRRGIHELNTYETRYEKMGWLLGKWHNALYHLLEPELGG